MADKTFKYPVAAAIALLLVFRIGTMIAGLLGIVAALTVTAISFVMARLAGAGAAEVAIRLRETL